MYIAIATFPLSLQRNDCVIIMIGLFFGSFNPLHNGHLSIARYLLDNRYCCAVWFVVSPRNPFKQDVELLAGEERLAMVALAIAEDERMIPCDVEFNMPRPSYTAQTLERLSLSHPEEKFALIMGADNLRDFHLWRNHEKITGHYPLLVYPRPGVDTTGICYNGLIHVDAPLSALSSTVIRDKVQRGEDITADVPAEILSLVYKHYSNTQHDQ